MFVFMTPVEPESKTQTPETDFSLSCPTPASVGPVSSTAKLDSESIKSVSISERTDQQSLAIAAIEPDHENGQDEEPVSLHLMTCGSLDRSIAAKSTAIVGYDSQKAYGSYQLQSVETELLEQLGRDVS